MARFVVVACILLAGLARAQAEPRHDCDQDQDFELAIKACSEIIARDANDARAFYRRAVVLTARANAIEQEAPARFKQDYDQAFSDINAAIRLDPRLSDAFRKRADIFARRRVADKALADFNEALRLDPGNFAALYNRGLLFWNHYLQEQDLVRRGLKKAAEPSWMGQRIFDRAIADFSGAAQARPQDPRAYSNRADVYWEKQDYPRAIADLGKVIELGGDASDALARRVRVQIEAKQAAAALTDADRLVAINAEDATAWLVKAEALDALGRRADAAAAARRAVWLDPLNEDARASYLKLKAFATAAAPTCVPGTRDLPAAFSRLEVTVKPGEARVGQPVTVSWSLPPFAKSMSQRAYLVLLLPDAVRVDGQGFFALAAGAPNPSGITFAQDRTRAIAPLHTAFAEGSGEIQVLPYLAGPLALEWAVVGADGCGEWIAGQGKAEPIAIGGGAPQIVLRDEFSAQQPDSVIRALKGPYRAHVFKDRFEIYDDSNGALVLRRQGREPTFSPTGRFLVLQTSVGETYEVIDLLARRTLGRYELHALHWSHADSFMWYEDEHVSKMQIVRTLHGLRHDFAEVVPTRREAKYERVLAGTLADMDEDPAARKARAPGVDIEPEGTTCARGCYAQEHWLLELSLDHGMVTFLDTFHKDVAPQVLVYDLAAKHVNALFENGAQGKAAFQQTFGIEFPALPGWELGDALWTTMIAYADDADKAKIRPTGRPIIASDARAKTAAAKQSNKDANKGTNKGAKTVERAARLAIPRDPAAAAAIASRSVIGAHLDHLPSAAVRAYRSSRDKAELRKIETEIARLYPPDVARFGVAEVKNHYEVAPFLDPNEAPPKERVAFDLTADGRDLWRWSIGGVTYWLTQTVGSDHLSHNFHFSLLTLDAAGKTRHLNLIKAANDAAALPSPHRAERADADDSDQQYGKANVEGDGPYSQDSLGDFRTELAAAFGDPSVVTISGERYLTVLSKPVPRLFVFDLLEWRLVCGIANPIDGVDAVSTVVHASARHVSQINSDGAIHVYACPSGANVLNGAYVDDELVVMDRNGYFDGSDDATGYVEVSVPGLPGRHVLAQFARALKRPGIAAEVLAGQSLSPPRIVAPPALHLAAADKPNGDVRLEAFSPSGLDQIQLFADGRLYQRSAASGNAHALSVTAAERAQLGLLTAIAVDKSGLVSAPVTVPRPAGERRAAGRLLVLSIGVDHYPRVAPICGADGKQSCDLRFAVADARRVAAAVGKSRLYAGNSVNVLAGESAGSAAILSALDGMIATAGPGDTLVVSFAGHGLIDRNNALQLGLASTQLERLEETSLSFDAVSARLRESKARVVVLLDVCHAGLADRAFLATNDAAVSQLVTNSGASMVVLAASKGRQSSEETPQDKGGRFSTALEQILTRDRAAHDADGNGAISLSELYRGLKTSVVRASEGRQTPWLSRNLVVGDFDLF
jgi:tetratricopeptide (TPR) repeat protein